LSKKKRDTQSTVATDSGTVSPAVGATEFVVPTLGPAPGVDGSFAIETVDLVKEYWDREASFLTKRKKRVVDQVNLQVRAGEVYGFVGKNGAGKTTTIKMILGLTYPTSGSIRLFGHEGISPDSKVQIGFAPEKPAFYNHLRARELMAYAGELMGMPRKTIAGRTQELLELVGLSGEGNTLVMNFSKGMQQRLGVAQALISDPKLLIFDEPATGLDPFGRRFIKELILRLRSEGKTVFFSSHQLLDVQEVCDRVGIIHRGGLIRQDTVAAILEGENNLEEKFVNMIRQMGERDAFWDPKKVGE
jgi:ABC-2 type transport system ATP-binding protein